LFFLEGFAISSPSHVVSRQKPCNTSGSERKNTISVSIRRRRSDVKIPKE
jgi:hypothetical protein